MCLHNTAAVQGSGAVPAQSRTAPRRWECQLWDDGVYLRSGLVHKVLVCRNRCKVHVHRDKNASLNLLRLVQCQLRGEDRPPEFTRGEG